MEIIGLSGFARSGKDETAKVLVEKFGFTQVAFADKLRDFLYAMNPIVAETWEFSPSDPEPQRIWQAKDNIKVQDVIDAYGWGAYKETRFGPEIRRLLQRLGTEAGRQTMWDTIWIDASLTGLADDAKIVVSDARFYNEFDAVRARGGEIWRINRDGVGPANNHASEMEAVDYPHFSKVLNNSGTLEQFRGLVERAYLDFYDARHGAVVTAKQMSKADDNGLRSKPLRPSNVPEGVINSFDVPKRR